MDSAEGLRAALQEAFTSRQPTVVNVTLDPMVGGMKEWRGRHGSLLMANGQRLGIACSWPLLLHDKAKGPGDGRALAVAALPAAVTGRRAVVQAGVESGNVHAFNAPKAAA